MARDKITVHLSADLREMRKLFRLAAAFVKRADVPIEKRRAFGRSLSNLLERDAAFDLDSFTAPGTNKLVVTAQPTKRFLRLMAAAGAGD